MRTKPIPAELAATIAPKILATVVESASGCLLRKAQLSPTGYAMVCTPGPARDRSKLYAHRVVWTHLRGAIPDGLVIDHLCRVRNCMNVDHMEVVTNAENVLRSNGPSAVAARMNRCVRGHEFSVEASGKRRCKTCRKVADAARYARQKGAKEHGA